MGDMHPSASIAEDGLGIENATWSSVVFICSKCMKRQRREALRDDLRSALKRDGRRDIRIVACGCLDLCPKRGVTVAMGGELASPDPRLRVLDRDEDADALVRMIASR